MKKFIALEKNNGWICILIMSISVIGIACGSTMASPESSEDLSPIKQASNSVQVDTRIAEEKPFEYLIQLDGKVRSLYNQQVISETSGKLIFCQARAGARFAAGQVIAQLDPSLVQHQIERAKLAIFNGRKEYESQLLGYEELLKNKSQQQSDTIKQKLRISTGLAYAEQDLKEAEYNLTRTFIRAPFAGIIADVKVQQGELIKSGIEMFRIYDPGELILEVRLLEADITLVRPGYPAEINSIHDPSIKLQGIVAEIDPYVDENGLVNVSIKFNKRKQEQIFPGMNCSAIIKVMFQKTIVLPKEAVITRSGKPVVFTIENGRAKWNYVTTGEDNGKEVSIKSGIIAGQEVIVTNNLQLAHDAPVTLIRKH